MSLLRQYLNKIKNNEPINFDRFLKALPARYRQSARELFQSKLVATNPKQWIVSCDDEIFLQLWEVSEKPMNRAHSSLLGDSHKHRVSANLLMIYHQGLSNPLCPDVIYVSETNIVQNFESQKRLLLIENEENFVQYHSFCHTLSTLTPHHVTIENTDVALGGGNRASSRLLMNVYSKYDEVLCSFDYDLGGLKTFRSLKKELGDKVHFVQPSEYLKVSPLFKNTPKSNKRLLRAIAISKELGFLNLAETFYTTRHFMEQESLLGETNV